MPKRPLEDGDGSLHLQYCIFDWDDNVVHMPTRIWMESVSDGAPVPLSTAEYAVRRNDPELRHAEGAFREFRDETGSFSAQLKEAMLGEKWQAPAFGAFKECLLRGRLFAIVTARGHGALVMRNAVGSFVEAILTPGERDTMLQSLRAFNSNSGREVTTDLVEDYLSQCHFVGVSSPEFQALSGTTSTEEGKKYAVRRFVKAIVETVDDVFVRKGKTIATISFGMSDDDRKNVEVTDALMRDELSPLYANVKFVVYDTGGGKVRKLKHHISDPSSPVRAVKPVAPLSQ
jgi:hypothetical protein